VVDYAEGGSGQVTMHEAFIYVFDAASMWSALTTFLFNHPGGVLAKPASVYIYIFLAKSDEDEGIPITAPYDDRA
jgi:hypothetical protein